MWAITPNGVGNPVEARRIRSGWPLLNNETFSVEAFSEDMVLSEDQVSLRTKTQSELDAEARAEMQRLVNIERDRRIETITFGGKVYDFDSDSRQNISGAFSLALAAIGSGAQPGDYRWADPDEDFTWIAQDNTATLMDAQTTLAFGQVAASWKADHIRTARSIKDLDPIPTDYADDSRWPTA